MVSVKRILRLFPIFALLVSLITPLSVATQVAAQASTGSLSISLIDDLGNAVPGGCFSIVDSAGTTFPVCDDDGVGTANLAGLAEGDTTVEQTSGPDGYTLAEIDTVAIVADEVATLELVSASIPTPTPTEEPTATEEVPTETATATEEPTEEATATEEATETATATEEATSPSESTPEDDPGFAAAAEDEHSLQLDCAHSPGSLTTDFRFVFGHLLADPDGPITVVLSPFNNRMEPQPPITINVYDTGETYFDMEWRHVDLVVTWPDDFEANGEVGCNTDRQVVNINTVSLDSSSNPIANGGQIPTGTTFSDTASLSNATINAGGTATYSLYAGLNCDSPPVSTQTVTVTGAVIPPATAFTPPSGGLYRWRVAYSGDALNQPVTSSCDSEVVLSGKATPTLTTHI